MRDLMNLIEGQGDILLTKEIVLKDGTPATLEAKQIGHGISVNVEAAGEFCGGTTFGENSWANMPGTWSATTSHVNTEWRRKGVATAAYDAMEEMGYTVVPEPRHNKRSADAEAFWKNRKQVREGDYRGEHIAPGKEGGAPIYDLSVEGMYPDDVYGPNGQRYYAPDEPNAFSICMNCKGRPNKVITIYRAVPAELVRPKITPGDWVAITPAYAKEHGRAHLQGAYKIITKTVHARDIYTEGNSLDEWGYDPQPYFSTAQEDEVRAKLGMKTVTEIRAIQRAKAAGQQDVAESYEWRKTVSGDVEVMINVAKLDASFAKDREFYVGPQGAGGIAGRYERFGNWLKGGEAIGMPEVCLNDKGEISFINGRHRFAWMRDNGVTKLPVAVPAGDAKAVQAKFGMATRMVEDVLEFNTPGEVLDTREFGGLTFKRQEGGMHLGHMWFVYRGEQIIGAFAEDWRYDCLVIHTDLYPEFTRSGFGSIIYDFADTLAAERGLEVAPAYLQTDAAKRFWEKRRASKMTEGWHEEKSKIDAIDGERWTHLEALFASKGFHPIGSGSKSRVYGSDSYPYVVKLFRKDRAYEAFLNFAKAFPNKHYAKARGEVKTISDEGEYRIIRLEKLQRASEATARMYQESIRALTALRVLKALEHHDEDDLIASFERFANYGIKDNAHLMAMIEKDEQVLADMNPTFVEAMRQIIDSFSESEVGAFDTNPANVMERPDGTPVIIDPLQPRY